MSPVNQLLAKALSTSSDDEAIACLRMARKKSPEKTLDVGEEAPEKYYGEYQGRDARYWYNSALRYYDALKHSHGRANAAIDSCKAYRELYDSEHAKNTKLYAKNKLQEEQLDQQRSSNIFRIKVIYVQFVVIIVICSLVQITY